MAVFSRVAELQSFAGAARALNMSRPAVSRAIAFLEDQVGAELLARTTRSVALSQVGAAYLEDCRRILEAVAEAEAAAAGRFSTPSGRLVLTAPVQFGRLHVLPVLHAFLREHAEVSAHLMLVDRLVRLVDEGVDVGVRIGELDDSAMRAIRVGEVVPWVVASPDYLARRGVPRTPDELVQHDIVSQTHLMRLRDWTFGPRRVDVEPRVLCNDIQAVLDLVAAGSGLARVLSYQAVPGLRSGALTRVLTEHEPAPIPVHLIHPGGRRVPARTRAFLDFARGALGSRLRTLDPVSAP